MSQTVGFIGSGNMASAIISGIISSKMEEISLLAYDIKQANYETLSRKGVQVCQQLEQVAKADYIVLAVKPQNIAEVMENLKPIINQDAVIVSIAAGITESYLCQALGYEAKVVLVMPNTPLLLGQGATAMSKGNHTGNQEFEFVRQLFALSGAVEVIFKDKMCEIIAINGSSPAYIYLFAKGFLEYAKKEGISEEVALHLFTASLKGSASMMTDSGHSIDELIKMVSSPGGTTLAGLDVFYQDNFTDTIIRACDACTKRAYELSK